MSVLSRPWCVVAIVRLAAPASRRSTDMPSADPSVGSVPAPTSSSRTSELGVAASMMAFMRATCAEKVESDCAMLCSSPMSAITRSNHGISTSPSASPCSSHSSHSPALAISAEMPRVLSETVFPPVLGPVTTTARTKSGTSKSIGTTALALGALPLSRHTSSGWHS